MENYKIRQLNRAYKKSFKKLYKNFFTDRKTGLLIFVEYLKYLRDSLFISDSKNTLDELTKTKISALTIAIAEFEAFMQAQDSLHSSFHWSNFIKMVDYNMEEWLKLDDSI